MAAGPRVSEGSELGSYRILRKLGEGGMGAVFEAVHTSIGRHAAIKVLHPESAVRTDVVQRFFNEARAVNLIDHPALVQIWDFGQSSDGIAYIVMEYLRGESLGKKIQRHSGLQVAEALDITRQIASALAAVHEKGIVHRDLKPDNVFLVPNSDGSGRIVTKLLDFGIAKLMEGKQPGDVQTRSDMVIGTPAYMSPEQCRGAHKVDGRADVYSLGVMLYEMLAGKRPFIAEGAGGVFGMHMYEEAVPVVQHAPHVPEPVAALVHRLLVKDRNLRPTSSELTALVQQLEGGELPTGAIGHSAEAPKRRWFTSSFQKPRPSLSEQSTLGSLTGESGREQRNEQGRKRRAVISAGLVGVLALVALATWTRERWLPAKSTSPPLQVAAGPPEKSAVAAAPRTIVWNIVSDPPGAEVVNKNSGIVLGATPLLHKQLAAPGQVVLGIRRSGYQSVEITLDGDSNNQIDRHLQPASRSSVRPAGSKTSASLSRRDASRSAPARSAKPEASRASESSPRPNLKELLEK